MLSVSSNFRAAEQADVNQVSSKVYLILGNYAASSKGSSASASSTDSSDYPASGVIDGDRTELNVGPASGADNDVGLSSWRSATAPSVTPQTITINMGQSRTINRIKLYHLASHALSGFKFESSPDNSSWTLISKTTDQGGTLATTHQVDTIDFSDTTCRYVRLTVANTVVGADKANVVEIEIYRLVDISSRVLSANLDRARDYKLGNPLASTLQIVCSNSDRFFSFSHTPTAAETAAGFINTELAPNIGILAKYGFAYGGGAPDVAQVFVGYLDRITLSSAGRTATIEARDGMKSCINQTVSSKLKTSQDLSACIKYALNLANISTWEMSLDSTGITLDYFFINNQSAITVVRDLVQAAGDAVLYFNESGTAVFKTFLNNTPQSKIETTEADFEAATVLTNIDTTSTPDQISRKWFLIDDFADGDFTSNPVWMSRTPQGSASDSDSTGWFAGTVKTNVNVGIDDGTNTLKRSTFLIDDFSDGDYTVNPKWTIHNGNYGNIPPFPSNHWSVSGNRLVYAPAATLDIGRANISFTPAYGSWKCDMRMFKSSGDGSFITGDLNNQYARFWLVANTVWTSFGLTGQLNNGYYVQIGPKVPVFGGGIKLNVSLWKSDASHGASLLGEVNIDPGGSLSTFSAEHTMEVTHRSTGDFSVYLDSGLQFSASDNTFTTSVYCGCEAYSDNSITNFSFGNLFYATDDVATNEQASFESRIIDQGPSITSEGIFNSVYTIPDGGNDLTLTSSVSFFTATSADGVTFDSYIQVAPGSFIPSVARRYIKYKILFSTPADNGLNAVPITPTVSSVTLSWVDTGWQCVSNAIKYAPGATGLIAGIDTVFTAIIGTWRANMVLHNGSGFGMKARMYITETGYDIPTGTYLSGYYTELDQAASKIRICKIDASATRTTLAEVSQIIDTAVHSVRLTRSAAGAMNLYWDEVFAATATDTTFSSNSALAFEVDPASDTNGYCLVDDVNFSPVIDGTGAIASTQAIFISDVIDMTASVTALGLFRVNYVTPTGTSLTFYTATSADNVTYGAYVAVTPDSNIASAINRYLKYKIVFTCPIDNGTKGTVITPVVTDVTINWTIGTGSAKYPTSVSYTYRDTGMLLDLSQEMSDVLGGDTAILNDIAVQAKPLILSGAVSDTQWQRTTGSPAAAISGSNPLNVTNGQTLTYAVILGTGMDTSLMSGGSPAAAAITFASSAAGTWSFTRIHPTRPTLQIVITASGTITDLRIIGKTFANSNTIAIQTATDSTSIQAYGDRPLSISNSYIINSGIAASIATRLLANYKDAIAYVPSCTVRPSFAAQIGDMVRIVETNTDVSFRYIIIGLVHAISASVGDADAKTYLTLLRVIA